MRNLIAFLICMLLAVPCTADIVDPDPKRLLEAQLLAIEVEGQLQPTSELAEQIYGDLAAIRGAYSDVAHINFRPRAVPDEILVGITQEAAEQFRNGQYHALDELNEFYGVIEIRTRFYSSYSFLVLKFNQVYNTQLLSQIYTEAALEGVLYVEPNYIRGDGPTIIAEPPIYIFIDAWGDCPAGCIYHEYWPFKVERGQVVLSNEYYVDAVNGDDRNIGFSPRTAFATIQKAIDDANDGDEVVVVDGMYTGEGNRDIDFKGKAITVRSTDPNDPNVVTMTIIDCDHAGRGFYFHTGEDANSVLAGFTITNGYEDKGGGIYCEYCDPAIIDCIIRGNSAGSGGGMANFYSSPKIINCTFTANSADSFNGGGGMINFGSHGNPMASSNSTLVNCTFSENSATRGGGITNYCSSPIVINCSFSRNAAYGNGGGGAIFNSGTISNPSNSAFINCLFENNQSTSFAAGVFNDEGDPILRNCTIVENFSPGYCSGFYTDDGYPELTNCILWGNIGSGGQNEESQIKSGHDKPIIKYSCVQDWTGGLGGIGNISDDPCFVGAGIGDYHLLEGSPCVDTGDPNYIAEPNETDLDGNPRVIGDRIDMGAYEFNPPIQAEMRITPQMLNCKSNGNWVKAHIVLPEGYTADDVDVDEPAFAELPHTTIDSEYIKLLANDEPVKLEIAFDRKVFCDLLAEDSIVSDNNPIDITVIGYLTTGQYFYGSDTIRIKH